MSSSLVKSSKSQSMIWYFQKLFSTV